MKYIAIFLIRIYQALQASFFTGTCRFYPTCSHYAVEAFEIKGFWKGLFLTSHRLVRCQPFCKGGWDPVPRDPVPRDPIQLDDVTVKSLEPSFVPKDVNFKEILIRK